MRARLIGGCVRENTRNQQEPRFYKRSHEI